MLTSFFSLAMVSPGRQKAFRFLITFHILFVAMSGLGLSLHRSATGPVLLGQALLLMAIVEGALLIGWRLTQMPKSQALEFILVSPVRPPMILLAEASVGLGRLTLATLSGLPILLFLAENGVLAYGDVPSLLLFPHAWGAVTGVMLTMWAYEPEAVRKIGERILMAGILFYLIVGVLAGENLPAWLSFLPTQASDSLLNAFRYFHHYNPFGVMKYALEIPADLAWPRVLALTLVGWGIVVLALTRAAFRLHGHFHDRHYKPISVVDEHKRKPVSDRPLAWWAVKRVSEYSGRINLWLAGGFGILYAAYTVAGDAWPPWMGKQAFVIFDRLGGLPMMTTALVLLAAVPAAFQYGLWDSNAQDRCRRLELLLLTRLDAWSYWDAAAAAAWRRGRGYFLIALILWGAAVAAGKLTPAQGLICLSAGAVLWGLYFSLGFRAFTRGHQANSLGLLLTLGLPLLTFLLCQADWRVSASLLPPGSVYLPGVEASPAYWWLGSVAGASIALALGYRSRSRCDAELRRWYDIHHGQRVVD